MDDLRSALEQALGSNYTFERELGGGGMSRTYLVTENALQRKVVVKVLAPELLAGMSVERFRREILLAAALQHPHVVPVLTAGDAGGVPWFTMPYVEGNSLRQRIERQGIPLAEAVSILRDVARALAYAHARGIVHRDIKPDNVLLSGGSATVTDFGIAKAINAARTDADPHHTLTQVGTSIGTPAYMAPEQALGDPDTDHRADIYAFGVMAYEMIAGRPPFQGNSPSKLLAAHMGEAPPHLLGMAPNTPVPLAELVMQCMEKNPDHRPQEASQVARVLDSVTTSGSGGTVPAILRDRRVPMGKALAMWALAAVLVVVTAWAARAAIGLPDWVLPGAIGVMLAGLPVLLATAYVQRETHRAFTMTPGSTSPTHGTMQTLALKASPHLSWKRAWTGGAFAVGGFAVLVIGFMVLRAFGIGPMGSLRGKGVFGTNEMLVVADFDSPASDSTLGMTVAEALRTDLAQSSSLNVLSRATLRENLGRMERSDEPLITFELAREIATREGAKAVLDGGVVQLGQGYVISARLVAVLDGRELATFRETANNEDALIGALGSLSRAVRERTGESLKDIQASRELERVTTSSLAALRKYVEGNRIASEVGDQDRGLEMLREAVAIDSTFAMAWRKIAVLLSNMGRDPQQVSDAAATAYRHRAHLTEAERLLTEAYYFINGPTPDRARAIAAYDAAIELDSLNGPALNNSALHLENIGQREAAAERYARAARLPRTFSVAFTNLLETEIELGHVGALDSILASFHERLPGSTMLPYGDWLVAWGKGDLARADSISEETYRNRATSGSTMIAAFNLSETMLLQGRLRENQEWLRRAREEVARTNPTASASFRPSLDTAFFEAGFGGGKVPALAALDRGRRRVPMDSISTRERPWGTIAALAWWVREPQLAREALRGWEQDQAAFSLEQDGDRARFQAQIAMAEQRWSDAIPLIDKAQRLFGIEPQSAEAMRGTVYDAMGQPDSARAAFERYVGMPDEEPGAVAWWRPRTLVRLGELYEASGNRAKAIQYYGEFVALWKDADPDQQPRVREMRARIARLQGESG